MLLKLLARKPRKLVAVALANKMARTVWAMMRSGEDTGASHSSPGRRPHDVPSRNGMGVGRCPLHRSVKHPLPARNVRRGIVPRVPTARLSFASADRPIGAAGSSAGMR